MTSTTLGMALALAALMMFSSNIILTKLAMARLSLDLGFVVAVSVNLVFGALAFAVDLALRSDAVAWNGPGFWMFLAAGVLTTYLGRFFFFETVARLGPAKASTFQISSPLFTVLIAWLALGERIGAATFAAMVVVVVGLYLVSVGAGDAARAPGVSARHHVQRVLASGVGLGLGSALAYAVGNVLRGAAIHRWDEPILGALLGAVSGIVLHFTFSRARKGLVGAMRAADRRGIALFAVCGALQICAQMLTLAAMSRVAVSIVALVTLCSPVIVFPASYVLFRGDARITARVVAGTALALGGIAVIVLR